MKNFKIKLKFFLVNAIFFGVVMGIISGVRDGLDVGIRMGIISGILFGLWMTLIIVYKARKSGKFSDFLGPYQKTTIDLDSNLDNAFDKCVQAINQFPAKIKSQKREKSEIKANTKMSGKSWGENITVQLTDLKNGKIKIEISSSPRLITTLADYGKGRENVEKLASLLTGRDN